MAKAGCHNACLILQSQGEVFMLKRSIPFMLGAIALAQSSAFAATAIQLNQHALSPQVTLK